jgi:SAM-dependent methyltransferase
LCHSDDAQGLFEGRDRLHSLPGDFTVVQCRRCGLVYLNPRPVKGEIGVYYPDDYEPHVFFERIRHSRLARLDYHYGLGKRRRAIESFVQGGRLLDAGCGNGSFLYYMREYGWEVYGEEISQSAAAYARQELDLEVRVGELQDVAFPSQHFDAVTMWNVLEHLYDPAATLVEVRRILKPEGLLVIAVPNLASWDARVFGPAWVGYDVPRHLYTFSPETLGALLDRAGFQVVQRRCLFGSHQAIVISLDFALHGPGRVRRAQAMVKQVASWRPLRLLTAPVLRLMDSLGKGSLMTVFCQSRRGTVD